MFYGVYKQLKPSDLPLQPQSEEALLDWPANFEHHWVPYIQTPVIQWDVTLEGHVSDPRTLSYRELVALPQTYQIRRLASKYGWSYRSEWNGVLLQHLMPLVCVQDGVTALEVEDVHGNRVVFPLQALLKSNAMLVLNAGTQALNPWHGGPVRLMAFGYYAEASLGQVKALRFLTKLSKEQKALIDAEQVATGKYYCYDLKEVKENPKAGEIKGF
jgi:DMSO/TMAO reductase YedYZ molybdopterin-dependent catalytic subunit